MAPPDYSTWLTKQQAADAIGVSTKTVEKLAQDGKLQQASWRRPSGGPELAVYHPEDVARIAQERRPGPTAFVLPAVQTGNGHGAAPVALAAPTSPAGDPRPMVAAGLADFAAALRLLVSQSSPTSEKSENPAPLFLTIRQAAAISGLSQAQLRRYIADGTLGAVRDRGWRIRRRDLERL